MLAFNGSAAGKALARQSLMKKSACAGIRPAACNRASLLFKLGSWQGWENNSRSDNSSEQGDEPCTRSQEAGWGEARVAGQRQRAAPKAAVCWGCGSAPFSLAHWEAGALPCNTGSLVCSPLSQGGGKSPRFESTARSDACWPSYSQRI